MKKIFTKNLILIICLFALIIGGTNYVWQKTATVATLTSVSHQEIPFTTTTQESVAPPSVLAEESSTKSLVSVAKPSKTNKVTSQNLSKSNSKASYDDRLAYEDDEEEAKEAAERKSVQGRWAAEFEMIKNPATGQIPKGIHLKEVAAAKKTRELQLPAELGEDGVTLRTLPTIGITSRGPNNYGGRTRAIAFDVRAPNIVLAGGVSSGIFRSTDGGATWARVTPAGEIHSVTAFAQDPRGGANSDIWYCGTGENPGNSASGTGASYLGNGVLKSTDNGLTWTPLASTRANLYAFDSEFDYVNRIIVDPAGNILVAASETIQYSTAASGGMAWTNGLGTYNTGVPSDIIYNAASSTYYASIHGSNASGGIYRSTDGIAWTQIRMPAQLQAGGVKRIVLSNVANTANILALYETNTPITCTGGGTSNAGLQLFNPAGAGTWTDFSDKIGVCAGGSANPKNIAFQDGYNMCITTKPNDADLVYLGGTEIYRFNLSTFAYDYIGGSQLPANATNLHVDNHLLIFQGGSNNILWAGNDGGLRTTNVTTGTIVAGPTGGYTWSDKTSGGYVTYQYYGADIHPTNGSNFIAGAAQDNAFTIQPSTAEAKEVGPTVDGVRIGLISGTDFNTYSAIISWQEGAIARLTNGTDTDIKPTSHTQGFITTFLLDADNTNYLYYPTNAKKLIRTRNASAIANGMLGDPATNWEEITGVAAKIGGNIVTMAVSRNTTFGNTAYSASDANRKLYMGTNGGMVYRLNDPAFCTAATQPVDITPAGSLGYVSSIAVNPYDDKEVLVTYSNYGVPSVWYTADASVASPTWVNVEGAAGTAVELASARSAMIVRAGSTPLYIVGTSTGLYGTTTLSGATTVWEKIGASDIAFSPSVAMRLRTSDNKMVLGTHGNGLFMLTFPQAVLPLDLLAFEAAKNKDNVKLKWVSANETGFSHYNVQKSDDGKYFSLLTTVKATGSGTYQTVDDKPFAGQNYYRLEMVDVDGKRRFSKVVNVTFDTKVNLVSVYPNPAKTSTVTLDLTINNESDLIFEWTDIAGRTRLRSQQKVAQGNSQISVDVSDLESGLYFITTKNVANNETLRVMRFIKQ